MAPNPKILAIRGNNIDGSRNEAPRFPVRQAG